MDHNVWFYWRNLKRLLWHCLVWEKLSGSRAGLVWINRYSSIEETGIEYCGACYYGRTLFVVSLLGRGWAGQMERRQKMLDWEWIHGIVMCRDRTII